MSKVFILGIDGATLDVMLPMIQQGELPAFGEIMKKGGYGRLRSVVPPLSPPAWTSFATGKNPGKHGIIGFTRMDTESYKLSLVTGQDNRSRTIWELFGNTGKKVIVLNMPMTYPPRPLDGLMISGLDTPDVHSEFTYPKSLKEEIFSKFPQYKINLQLGGYLQNDRRRRKALRMILENIETRYKVAEYLMDNYPWELFIVKFNNPDIVQHHFWKYMDPRHPEYDGESGQDLKDAIPTVYKRLDAVASSLMKKLDKETTFMVMSDHGGGARLNKVFYINEWLQQEGFLHTQATTKEAGNAGMKGRFIRRLYRGLNGPLSLLFRHTTPQMRRYLKNALPNVFSRLSLHFKYSGWMSNVDWDKTMAFLAEQECIRINLQGCYPNGIVPGKRYEAVRDTIIGKLKELTDPETSEKVFEDVLTREEAFGENSHESFPDIQLVTKEAKYDVLGKFRDRPAGDSEGCVTTEPYVRVANGMHRPEGIFFMIGPHIKKGVEMKGLHLIDLCPTVLALEGIPLPIDLDGRIIEDAFVDGFFVTNPVQHEEIGESEVKMGESEDVYSSDEASLIMNNLKSLGYLE
jgi:predicted AlkP superfamily phosphohydrolase/phosphomutase